MSTNTLDHQLALILVRTKPHTGPNWWPAKRGSVGRTTRRAVQRKQAENVKAMHRVHAASQPKRIAKGCYAVYTPYGTLPTSLEFAWRLEYFPTVIEATDAFLDRYHGNPHSTLRSAYFGDMADHQFETTPLARLWIYRVQCVDTMPGYVTVLGGPEDAAYAIEATRNGTPKRVAYDPEDNRLRQIIEAEDRHRQWAALVEREAS